MDYTLHGILQASNTGVDSRSLLQGIFPTQGSNPGLQHCRRILYQLSHQGSPTMLGWVAIPFFPHSSVGKDSTCNGGDPGSILGWEDLLEKG